MKKEERIHRFVAELEAWYARHKRTLPWRDMDVEDPNERAYRVLVSEVMLQQTQVSRVQIVYKNFLSTFPDRASLAAADTQQVLLAWRGMGYNARALRLRDVVRTIVADHAGVFPREEAALRSLKGIGPYTAAAVRNFAWNLPTPCIDTNIRRILHRTFIGPERADGTWTASDRELLPLAAAALEHTSLSAADWHAALMDYGSLVQTKHSPKWNVCVLYQAGLMRATQKNMPTVDRGARVRRIQREPGRMIGAQYVPNRIIRGRIIESLRDEPEGVSFQNLGAMVCADWSMQDHEKWLHTLITKLEQDGMLHQRKDRYFLGNEADAARQPGFR